MFRVYKPFKNICQHILSPSVIFFNLTQYFWESSVLAYTDVIKWAEHGSLCRFLKSRQSSSFIFFDSQVLASCLVFSASSAYHTCLQPSQHGFHLFHYFSEFPFIWHWNWWYLWTWISGKQKVNELHKYAPHITWYILTQVHFTLKIWV